VPPAQGTYFQLVEYSAFSDAPDVEFAERLLTEAGVATIPLSPFYKEPPRLTMLRLCVAKKDQTLDEAIARLRAFANGLRPEVDHG
jgi:methionine aminotransferase